MTSQTPVFGIQYPEVGEPVRQTRAMLQANAETIEAAMIEGIAGPAGPPGEDGATGPAGPANVLTIGTVTTGAAGAAAAATITGTSPAQVLNLTLPKGDPGTASASGARPNRMKTAALYSWAGPPSANQFPTAGRLLIAPLPIDVPPPNGVASLGVAITSAATGSSCLVGVYSDTGYGYPDALLVSSGALSGTSTGEKTGAVTWAPTAGLYWLAILPLGATQPQYVGCTPNWPSTFYPASAMTDITPQPLMYVSGQSALPATFPATISGYLSVGPRPFVKTAA